MQYSAAVVLAAAAGAQAFASGNVSYTTEVVTAVTTYCPEATEITHAGTTYTVSSATTLTITDCPCTVTYPVSVSTSTCESTSTGAPPVTTHPAPTTIPYSNGTATLGPSGSPSGTGAPGSGSPGSGNPGSGGSSPAGTTPSTSPIATAGAGKIAALSGASLAGVLGLAALFL